MIEVRFDKLLACFSELGIERNVDTFTERKKLQKLTYLLQKFCVDLEVSYSWYLHGPYSPQLTRALFDSMSKTQPSKLTKQEAERVRALRTNLGTNLDSTDFLELIVSLDFIKAQMPSASLTEITQILRQKKPFFTGLDISRASDTLSLLERTFR